MDDVAPQPAYLSLVVATLGRTVELSHLLQTLVEQNDPAFETIIVDQNGDDRLEPVIAPFLDKLTIHHIRTPIKGLSRSRNLGAHYAKGSWLLFPDDDCWYPADFLQKLRTLIKSGKAQIYCGRALSPEGDEIMGHFAPQDTIVDRVSAWRTMIEWATLFQRDLYDRVGGFDEDLGIGSGTAWGANEGPDLILRCLNQGAIISYHTHLIAHHADVRIDRTSPANIRKIYDYNAGFGYVMRKHAYPLTSFLPYLLRPLAGSLYYALSGRWDESRRSRAILRGRWIGWIAPEARKRQIVLPAQQSGSR